MVLQSPDGMQESDHEKPHEAEIIRKKMSESARLVAGFLI